MKKTLALALSLLLVIFLGACVQPAPPEPTAAGAAEETTDYTHTRRPEPAVLRIGRATEELLSKYEAMQEFDPGEDGPGWERIVIMTDKEIQDFQYVKVEYDEERDKIVLAGALFSCEALTPDRPFVTTIYVPETIPFNGITFLDNGERKCFSISESGEDGSLLLIAFDV